MTTTDSTPDALEDSGFRVLLAALGALPLASYAVLLLFAAYASIVIGHWPAYSDPSRTLPLDLTTLIEGFITLSLFAGPVYAVTRFALCWERHPAALSPRVRRLDYAGLVCFGVGAILWLTASSRLLDWVLD